MTNVLADTFPHIISKAPHTIPATGYVRLSQIVGNPKAIPSLPAAIPVSKSTWWRWVKEGKAPKPLKLGEKTTVWRAEQIHQLIADLEENQES